MRETKIQVTDLASPTVKMTDLYSPILHLWAPQSLPAPRRKSCISCPLTVESTCFLHTIKLLRSSFILMELLKTIGFTLLGGESVVSSIVVTKAADMIQFHLFWSQSWGSDTISVFGERLSSRDELIISTMNEMKCRVQAMYTCQWNRKVKVPRRTRDWQ